MPDFTKSVRLILVVKFALLTCLFDPLAAHGDEWAQASRAVLAEHADAVVTIRIAVEMTFSSPDFGSDEQEFVIEATGFLINPRGYVAASLTATDPAGYYEDYIDDEEYDIRTEINEVTILLEDGSSFSARLALRDRDLDVVILKPKEEPQEPLSFIQFSDSDLPQNSDPVIILKRLGKVAGRACVPLALRIDHIMRKPRLFYLIHDSGLGLGEPAFSKSGSCFGIVTLRSIKVAGTESFSVFSESDLDTAVVILPGEDVIEIARQVPGYAETDNDKTTSTKGR